MQIFHSGKICSLLTTSKFMMGNICRHIIISIYLLPVAEEVVYMRGERGLTKGGNELRHYIVSGLVR